jgi:hypothetical protein
MNGIQVKRLGQSIPKLSLGGTLANAGSAAISGGMTAGPWGAVAMGGMSLISGLLGDANENKMEKERKIAEAKVAQAGRNRNDAMRYSMFNKQGNADNRMYMADGGIVKVKLKSKSDTTPKQTPKQTTKPKPANYVDNGILDNIGRNIALMPNTFNQAIDAIASPFTQMGMKSGSHPFSSDYWENIGDKIAKVGTADPHKWNNAYEHLPYDVANAALARVGGHVITKGVGAVGNRITKMYADKVAKPVIDKATKAVKAPSKSIPYQVGNTIRKTPAAIKNEATLLKDAVVGAPKYKGSGTSKGVTPAPIPAPRVHHMGGQPLKRIPQKASPDNIIPPTEILGTKAIPTINTIPYQQPPQKLLPGSNVFYQSATPPPNSGLLPQRTATMGMSENPALFRTRGITETYAPNYTHRISSGTSQVKPPVAAPTAPAQKLLPANNVFYQPPTTPPNSGLLPQRTGSMGVSDSPALFKNRGVTEKYSPNYTHRTTTVAAPEVKPPITNSDPTAKLIEYHAKSNLNMPFADFMKMYKANPGFMKNVNAKAGLAKGGIVREIAPGVKEVKAHTPGTDTVSHSLKPYGKPNAKPVPVNVDNQEVILNNQVVLSADKGHAQKYKSLLKQGYPKAQLDAIFIPKAIAGQSASNNLNLGGIGSPDNPPTRYWDIGREDSKVFDLATMQYVNAPTPTVNSGYEPGFRRSVSKPIEKEVSLSGTSGSRTITTKQSIPTIPPITDGLDPRMHTPASKLYNINMPTRVNRDFGDAYNTIGSHSTLTNVGRMNSIPPFTNKQTTLPQITVNKPSTEMPDYSFKGRLKAGIQSFKDMPTDKKQMMGHMGIAGLQLLGNTLNINKANKLKVPTPALINPALQDRTINDPMFASQDSQLRSSVSNMNTNALNTSNSGTAFARLGAGVQFEQQGLGDINTRRIGAMGQIDNENVRTINAAAERNNQAINQHGLMSYQASVDNLQNRSNMFNASMDTFKNLIEYKQKGNYDDELLSAIAKTYSINYEPGDTIDDLYKRSTGNAKKQLALLRG